MAEVVTEWRKEADSAGGVLGGGAKRVKAEVHSDVLDTIRIWIRYTRPNTARTVQKMTPRTISLHTTLTTQGAGI